MTLFFFVVVVFWSINDFLVFDLMIAVGDGEILICSDVDDDDDTLESSSHLIHDFLTF